MKFSLYVMYFSFFISMGAMAQQKPAVQRVNKQASKPVAITPNELVFLSDKSIGEIQENLTSKNWFFYAATEEKKGAYGFAKFVYDRPKFKFGDGAEYLMVYYYSEVADSQALELKFNNKLTFANFNEQILNLKYSITSSTVKDGTIVKVYKKGSQIIEVTIPATTDGGGVYKYLFCKKSSYKKIRGK